MLRNFSLLMPNSGATSTKRLEKGAINPHEETKNAIPQRMAHVMM